jgi:hypothetical protein
MKVLSDLKTRRVNDISYLFNLRPKALTPAAHIIMAFPRWTEKPITTEHAVLAALAGLLDRSDDARKRTNGIAIRACFGKPAF